MAFAASVASSVMAERAPRPVPADYRIRTVPFEKDNVVMLYGTMGVSTMIVFGEDERIATVAMGDTLAWQAVPDQSKRFLFLKPLDRDAATNMNVVTNKRIYNFVLKPGTIGARGRFTNCVSPIPTKRAALAFSIKQRRWRRGRI
ncbi:TrbG/VirB9 family P-type conjugative transfer protein [Methylocystis sp. JR02]|uniref:TrbG/VirB9 family P-type conjugative transfer protein n=1 Tax=Methylocystis sp. JR02 TaxID=3046284 RepID=UPI0024BAB5E1|nr:TrbG/VirB9 family P-type conjugative transfer protein [Methylocystis sp. JR02]MDJ0450941.1 TrbG/VirB9 family P-type conjugative transfer protein [Methylocystis sp. JR02]